MPRVVPSQIVSLIDQYMELPISCRDYVSHGSAAQLIAIVYLINKLPDELLTISGKDYNDLIFGVEAIKTAVTAWQNNGNHLGHLPTMHEQHVLLGIQTILKKCPDQSASPSTSELAFIFDDSLRDSIQLDVSTATSALHNGEWKASTVLSGSAAEALLLWAINEKKSSLTNLEDKPKGQPERWDFAEYIKVARSLDLIKDNTKELTTLAKNFRNLIHPGRAQRLGVVCDRATALTALAAVESIVRDLNSEFISRT